MYLNFSILWVSKFILNVEPKHKMYLNRGLWGDDSQGQKVEPKHKMYLNSTREIDRGLIDPVEPKHKMYLNNKTNKAKRRG